MGVEAPWSAAAPAFDRQAQALWTWVGVLAMERKAQNGQPGRVLA